MTRNDPGPDYVQFFSHSAFGVHVQQLSTTPFDVGASTFNKHSGGTIDAQTMFNDLVDKILSFYPNTFAYDTWRVFSKPDPGDVPLLVAAGQFTSKIGTGTGVGWDKATQLTISALGATGTKGRLVLLDAGTNDDWDGVFTLPGSGSLFDTFTEWSNVDRGWRTRGNERPQTFLEMSKTLNEKLRREYRMF